MAEKTVNPIRNQWFVRVFGTNGCENCKSLKDALANSHRPIPHQFVDAAADETQDLCDLHNVEELPHAQLIHTELDGRETVVEEYKGRSATGFVVLSRFRVFVA